MQKLSTVPARCRGCNRSKGLTQTVTGRKTIVQCTCGWQGLVNPDAPVDVAGAQVPADAVVH